MSASQTARRQFNAKDVFDVIVIGGGAAGSWAAKVLTENSVRVLLLEAGPASPGQRGADYSIQSRCAAFDENRAPFFVDDAENPYTTPADRPFHWFRGRQLGGRMCIWGRRTLRMSDYEFKAASRDGYGVDWPISYADLAPHYDRVERSLGVRGSMESVPQLPDGAFLPATTTALTRGDVLFRDAIQARWPDRRLIPGRVTTRDHTDLIDAALKTGRLTIVTNAVVSQITTDPSSCKARGAIYIDRRTHAGQEVRGRVVVLCASTVESTRLLLNSAPVQCPDGLGNSSGVIGHYVMDHTFSYPPRLCGITPYPSQLDAATQGGVSFIPNFRNVHDRHPRFIRGYGVECFIDRGVSLPLHHGLAFLEGAVKDIIASRIAPFHFSAIGEVLPRFENTVTIDAEKKDACGIPVARIDCAYSENEREMVDDQLACLNEMCREARFEPLFESAALGTPGQSAHELGAIRMGDNPRTSALNRFNQSWDVPNLFVTDGSCFVTAGYQNPTLTMMALTDRACEFIVDGLKRNEL